MNINEVKNELDILLEELVKENYFDVAEKLIAKLLELIDVKISNRCLASIPRVDGELSRFMLAPNFARQAAAYELPHEDGKPIDLKLFWIKKTNKTNLSWIIGLTPNFEDSLANDYKNVGIDFVVPETCDRVIILLSHRFKVRALELKDHITPTQLEILSQWADLSGIQIEDEKELKNTFHSTLWESFNFEPVTNRFYLELVEHFNILVNHLEKDFDRRSSVLFTTRLLGRLLFVWFLKKKDLIDSSMDYFSIADIKDQNEYYRNKLERLFFEVLNKNEKERNSNDHKTPYLNGGLFDSNPTDFFGNPKLTFPDAYFNQLFNTLNKYNFTVDESSPEFQHVAIDPEMLGRIFESLLAEQVDEDTGRNKKAITGAVYTPREIVNYMCEQSLIEYLRERVAILPDSDRRLEELIRMPESLFRDQDQNKRRDWKPYRELIIKLLEGEKEDAPITILDPAVGSGAFPMGMLHLLVKVYSRLDPKYEKNVSKLKRDILSRSLYGVDKEQIAIEITRLRAWLSIVVDIPKEEFVEPLPNLDFKFVCANTLIPLDSAGQATFTTDYSLKEKLMAIRDEYFKTNNKQKKEELQGKYIKMTKAVSLFDNKKTVQLKSYEPFDIGKSAEFYDPELMHGVKEFDIVIGNPPYVQIQKFARTQTQKDLKSVGYKTFEKTGDLYALFYEHGLELTKKETGFLCFITSNKWMRAGYGKSLRQYFISKNPKLLIDLGGNVFKSATVDTNILLIENSSNKKNTLAISIKDNKKEIVDQVKNEAVRISFKDSDGWFIGSNEEISLKEKIEKNGKPLKNWDVKINRGILTGLNEAFIIDKETRDRLIAKDPKSEEIIKPILRGRDIGRYRYEFADLYVLATGYDIDIPKLYPAIYNYLLKFEKAAKKRQDQGKNWWNLRACIYYDEFEKEKVVWGNISYNSQFSFAKAGIFINAPANIITSSSINIKYLVGVMNSKIFNYEFKSKGIFLGDAYEWKKQYVEEVNLPLLNSEKNKLKAEEIVLLVDMIIKIKIKDVGSSTKEIENKIDQLVCDLYDLNEEERAIILK